MGQNGRENEQNKHSTLRQRRKAPIILAPKPDRTKRNSLQGGYHGKEQYPFRFYCPRSTTC